MPKNKTAGLPTLWIRVHKKTGYHRDDIRKITYAVMDEMRLMMEEGVKEIRFERFITLKVIIKKARRCFDIYKNEPFIMASKYIPKILFNKTMVTNIKKLPVKE